MKATQPQPRTFRTALAPLIALTCALVSATPARAADESAAAPAAAPPVPHAHHKPRARDPAADLAKRLDLDAKQQVQVKRLLALRQAQIRRVWSDPAIDPSDRVGAVKAINDRTVAQIRELLTDEQKKKYIQPRPAGSPPNEPQPSVEDWLNATRPRNPDPSAPR